MDGTTSTPVNTQGLRPLDPTEHRLEIAWGIILSVLTCGIYNIYWNYRQFNTMNVLLGHHEYDFIKWLLLTIITCGLYHIYYEYKMGSDLAQILINNGQRDPGNLPLIGLVLSIFGLSVIVDAVFQHELNKLCR